MGELFSNYSDPTVFEEKITFAKFARVVNKIVNLAFTLTFCKKGRNRNVLTARCSFLIE